MKFLSIILFSLFSIFQFQTENYYIIKIKGKIYNESSGKVLKQGDAIKSDDKLRFIQKEAIALVISDARGRFSIKYPERAEESVGALTVFVKNALTTSQLNNLSTRSLIRSTTVNHLDTYLGNSTFSIIGNELKIKLSKKNYTFSKNEKIIVRYEANGQMNMEELAINDNTIKLSNEEIKIPDNQADIGQKVNIYQINISTGKKKMIASVHIRFIDKEVLEQEFLTIIETFKKDGLSKAKLNAFLLGYFNDFYGKTDEYILNQFSSKVINNHMVD